MNWTCPNCSEVHEDQFDSCWKCGTEKNGVLTNTPELYVEGPDMDPDRVTLPCSTTPYLPGRTIERVVGLVFGEAIMGANIINDFAASLTDIVGGRSGAYEGNLRQGRKIAIQEMIDEAKNLGADAVVGVDIDYETVGDTMLMVAASGTAVKLVPELTDEIQVPLAAPKI